MSRRRAHIAMVGIPIVSHCHHAGMGGCGEGLLAGVPMIAVPQAAEQFVNADRLVELGVARRIDTPDATAETLRAALSDLVADPEVARRSARLRAEARADRWRGRSPGCSAPAG
ncbi:nucleotide disphospho-sugar-binding domain-containing protein [Nonomuraea cavernae]